MEDSVAFDGEVVADWRWNLRHSLCSNKLYFGSLGPLIYRLKASNKINITVQLSKKPHQTSYDVIVIGGGAAGLMAAITAGKRGRSVLVIEVSNKLGKKILMSGGGRCNFTNLEVKAEHFICENAHFVKSALNQYTNWDFISLVATHGIDYHEKGHGQLFCDNSSKDILNMLLTECDQADVDCMINTNVSRVEAMAEDRLCGNQFLLSTESSQYQCQSVIVATGGLSIPTLGGATGLGYKLAEQFGLDLLPRSASLVPFTLSGHWHELASSLSGVSLPVYASVANKGFSESMLFTHRGLSGPAILQLSNYWGLGDTVEVDLIPSYVMREELLQAKAETPNKSLGNVLGQHLGKSLASSLINAWWPDVVGKVLHELKSQRLVKIGNDLNRWSITPSGTEGYRTAEVTKGGVSVDQISSKTMRHKEIEGLFFVGEVLDVTGQLGGFNFQWAWSSGYVAGSNA